MLQISKKVNWLPATLANSSEAAVEIPKRVQTKENSDAHATISMMPPVVFARINQNFPQVFKFYFLINNHTDKQTVHNGYGCRLGRCKDASVDTAQR